MPCVLYYSRSDLLKRHDLTGNRFMLYYYTFYILLLDHLATILQVKYTYCTTKHLNTILHLVTILQVKYVYPLFKKFSGKIIYIILFLCSCQLEFHVDRHISNLSPSFRGSSGLNSHEAGDVFFNECDGGTLELKQVTCHYSHSKV